MGATGFTLTQLQYFCAVAELRSFSAAADAQQVSANAVASAVSALETSLRSQLCIRRRSRGIELTPSGKIFYEQAKDLLAQAAQVYLSAASTDGVPRGAFLIGCVPTLTPTVLSRVTAELLRRHPRAILNLSLRSQEVLVDQLQQGEIDCAFLYDIELPPTLEKRELYRRTPQVLVSSRHPLASRKSINLRELANERLILLTTHPARDYTLRLLAESGVTPTAFHEVNDHTVSRALVARGFGYTITLLDTYLDKSETGKTLVSVPIAPKHSAEGITLVWTSTSGDLSQVQDVIAVATSDAARPRRR